MTDIEKRAYEKYPEDINMVDVPSSGLTPFDSNEKYRDGYIKCAEEYESLPKIRGWAAQWMMFAGIWLNSAKFLTQERRTRNEQSKTNQFRAGSL